MAHVTSSDYYMWASGDSDNPYRQRPKVATGLRANMILVLYPGLLKSDRYLLRLLYIHVTSNSWASGDSDSPYGFRPKIAMVISSSMTLAFYPLHYKSSQYLLRLQYIHVTGGNNGVWNIKERNRVEMSILWGNGNITGAGQACVKSYQYLLRPTLVRFTNTNEREVV